MEGNGIFPCIGEKWQFKTLQNLEIDLPRHKNDPEKSFMLIFLVN